MTTFIHQTFGQRSAFTCHIPTAIQAVCIPDNQQFTVQTLIQLICLCVSVFLMNIKTCIITYCTCLYMPSHSYYTLYPVLTVSCRCLCSCCCCVLCCGMADIVIYEPASVHRVCLRFVFLFVCFKSGLYTHKYTKTHFHRPDSCE